MLQEIRPGRPRGIDSLDRPEQNLGVEPLPQTPVIEIRSPGEISSYLFRLLSDKRSLSSNKRGPVFLATVFRRDPEVYRRIGKYEKDLALFLLEPVSQEVGRSLQEGEERIRILQLEYSSRRLRVDDLTNEFEAARQKFLGERQALERRIATAGRGPATREELGLLFGRIRVGLWQLKRQNRLSLLGSLLYRVIGSLPAHPAVLPLQGEIGRVGEQINAKKREKEELKNQFVQDRVLEGKKIASGTVEFLEILDGWAAKDLDLTIVQFLYYQDPSVLEIYARINNFTRGERRSFLQRMVIYGLLEDYARPSLVLESKDPSKEGKLVILDNEAEIPNTLPIEILVGGQTLSDKESAREEVFSLMKNFGSEQRERVWQTVFNELKFMSQGSHTKRFTTYHA